MSCTHDLEAEYLYPGDFDVLEVDEGEGTLKISLAVPCPDCGGALKLDAAVESVEEADFDLPLDDELYD